MHPVAELIHARLRREQDIFKLAVVAESSGQKWPVLSGMASRLEAHGITGEILGGTSGGALMMLYFAQQQTRLGTLNLNHLSSRGYGGDSKQQFLSLKHLLSFKPVMDIEGLVDISFTKLIPLNWTGFQNLKKVFFVTSTTEQGHPKLLRLDGLSINECKKNAKTTARIPLIGGWLHRHQEWDGGLTQPLPIAPALTLGATHVLALRCKTTESLKVEHLFLRPLLKLFRPSLAKLLKSRDQKLEQTEQTYGQNKNVLMVSIPDLKISSACTCERTMMEHAIKGWHAAGETLHLPPLPYPTLWQPTMVRLGLAEGAEFA